jgi:dynein heavy chain 1
MGDVLSPTAPNGAHAPPAVEADPLNVLEHIANLIEITLGAARRELEAVGSLLSKAERADSLDKCAKFASDSQITLFAQKDIRDELVNGHDDTPSRLGPWKRKIYH